MRKILFCLIVLSASKFASAQKVDSIYFNLYTDSLKKGFFNYINIDGKLSNGAWQPLDTSKVSLTSNTGFFKGNDLFIDSSYHGETVHVKVVLKANPAIWKETTIYIRKRGFDEPLKTNEEILNDLRNRSKKAKKKN